MCSNKQPDFDSMKKERKKERERKRKKEKKKAGYLNTLYAILFTQNFFSILSNQIIIFLFLNREKNVSDFQYQASSAKK